MRIRTAVLVILLCSIGLHAQETPKKKNSFVEMLKDKPVMSLAIAHSALGFADVAETENYRSLALQTGGYFQEKNPFAAMVVNHPALYYADTTGEVILSAWLAQRMKESQHPFLRKAWWVPQVAGIAVRVLTITYTSTHHVNVIGAPMGAGVPVITGGPVKSGSLQF